MVFILCRYKSGCFGCCGTEFQKKEENALIEIRVNTKELKDYKQTREELVKFRERHGPLFEKKGKPKNMCRNIVQLKDNTYGCSLHPAQHKGDDIRDNYCYKEYLCPTFKNFIKWEKKKQDDFVKFLDAKDLDVYDYSYGMDSGKIKKEFEELYSDKDSFEKFIEGLHPSTQ